MKIERFYNIDDFVLPGKVLIIYGPRQVGKTTLLKDYLQTQTCRYRFESGDDLRLHEVLGSNDAARILEYSRGYDLVVIDEAQKVPHIGNALKILIDARTDMPVIATGSSSFELAGQVGEPLTGRKKTLTLFPVSQLELKNIYNDYDLRRDLEKYLVFGSYPEIFDREASDNEKREILGELASSYVLKDILTLEKIKGSKILLDLLRLLAFQVGKEVSHHELACSLSIDSKTVARYLDLLEKSFVVFSLSGFSGNLRKEITKKKKYYFYDNGVRNALIQNFNTLNLRDDAGMLWENFIVVERMKQQFYQHIHVNNYFWRTYDQQEVDFVEERGGVLHGYEIKYGSGKVKEPKDWQKVYNQTSFEVITPDNYLPFIK